MSWLADNVDRDVVEYLFNLKVTLPERIGLYQKDIVPDLTIDMEMMEKQLEDTPQMIAFFNMLLAEQKMKVALLERKAKLVRGKIAERLIQEARQKDLDIRRTDMTDIMNADQQVLRVETELIKEIKVEDKLKTTVDSLIRKFEALRSLAGFKREERKSA